jgi:hypothetical protein
MQMASRLLAMAEDMEKALNQAERDIRGSRKGGDAPDSDGRE